MQRTLYALLNRNSDVGLKNMSGPVGIIHGLNILARQGWVDFIWFLALINVNLAIFNLLPIPVLDGGHMLLPLFQKYLDDPFLSVLWSTYKPPLSVCFYSLLFTSPSLT